MPPAEFLDCELYLTDYNQARLSVAGRDYSGRPALDDALQQRLLGADLDPKQYGSLLFESLFPGEEDNLLAGYRDGLAIARHEEKRLRLRLHIADTADRRLHDFYWEYLYDPKQRLALGRSRETTLSRYLSVSFEPRRDSAERPLRLLVVIPSPSDLAEYRLPSIDPDRVREAIGKALDPQRHQVTYRFFTGPVTPGRLQDRLVTGRFQALHIHTHGLIHGTKPATVVLEKSDRRTQFVEAEDFSGIFGGDRELRLVTFVACHSGIQTRDDPFSGLAQAIVRRGVPAVVAMRRAISVDAATHFTEHFYRNLSHCGQVDAAINEARSQM
ncbi:MAG: CHAT domain-containing protein, partial [Acidobacteriota bacterium]